VKVFKLAAGLAIGYVLGSRAGRDKYDQIVAAARRAQNHPAVTQTKQKAKQLLGSASAAAAADTGTAPPATVSATPVSRPPRRRTTTGVTAPEVTADPPA